MKRRYRPSEPKYAAPSEPHYVVGVDLGKRKVGLAVMWVDPANDISLLVKAVTVNCGAGARAMAKAIVAEGPTGHPVRWVCEWPMKYKDKRLYHEAIESLHAVGHETDRLINGWDEKYRPGQWKGNVPKRPHHRRIRQALRPEEIAVMPPVAEHDAWDAAGIALYAAARTRRGAVPQ